MDSADTPFKTLSANKKRKGEKVMGKIKVAWNKNHTKSVVLQKLKEFSINQNTLDNSFRVSGWYNRENAFIFGDFNTREEAETYLQEIHNLF